MRDYWITLGMPGLGQLPSAFSWPLPRSKGAATSRIHPSARGERHHSPEERNTNSSHVIVPRGSAKGRQGWVMFLAPGSRCRHTWSSSCVHRACPVPAMGTAVDLGSVCLGRGQLWVWRVAQRAQRVGEEGKVPAEGSNPRVSPSLRLSRALEPQPGTQRGLREQLLGASCPLQRLLPKDLLFGKGWHRPLGQTQNAINPPALGGD